MGKNLQKYPQNGDPKLFFKKWALVTYVPLLRPNFIQIIIKTWRAVSEIQRLTERLIDRLTGVITSDPDRYTKVQNQNYSSYKVL